MPYTVKKGDSWTKIAGDVYGDQRMFEELQRANPGINMLQPGMVLNLPKKQDKPTVSEAPDPGGQSGLYLTAPSGDGQTSSLSRQALDLESLGFQYDESSRLSRKTQEDIFLNRLGMDPEELAKVIGGPESYLTSEGGIASTSPFFEDLDQIKQFVEVSRIERAEEAAPTPAFDRERGERLYAAVTGYDDEGNAMYSPTQEDTGLPLYYDQHNNRITLSPTTTVPATGQQVRTLPALPGMVSQMGMPLIMSGDDFRVLAEHERRMRARQRMLSTLEESQAQRQQRIEELKKILDQSIAASTEQQLALTELQDVQTEQQQVESAIEDLHSQQEAWILVGLQGTPEVVTPGATWWGPVEYAVAYMDQTVKGVVGAFARRNPVVAAGLSAGLGTITASIGASFNGAMYILNAASALVSPGAAVFGTRDTRREAALEFSNRMRKWIGEFEGSWTAAAELYQQAAQGRNFFEALTDPAQTADPIIEAALESGDISPEAYQALFETGKLYETLDMRAHDPAASARVHEIQSRFREQLRTEAQQNLNEAFQLVDEDYEEARRLVLRAVRQEAAAAVWTNRLFAYTWLTDADAENAFIQAVADATLQKGERLTNVEIYEIQQRYVDPTKEAIGEMTVGMALVLPDATMDFLLSGSVKAVKGLLGASIDLAERIPKVGSVISWLRTPAARSVSHSIGHGTANAVNMMARSGVTTSVGENSLQSLMETAGRVARQTPEALADEMPLIGRTNINHLQDAARITRGVDMENVHRAYHSLVRLAKPENWGELVQTVHETYFQRIRMATVAELLPQVNAGRMTMGEARRIAEVAAQTAADDPRRMVSMISDHFRQAYLAVHTPIEVGRGTGLLDDNLSYLLLKTIDNTFGTESVKRLQDGFFPLRLANAVRNMWTAMVLPLRPGWTMINAIDSTTRYMIEGGSLFDDYGFLLATNYEKMFESGMMPEELIQTFMREGLGEGQSVAERAMRGERPVLGPLGYIGYEWKRLGADAPENAGFLGRTWQKLSQGYGAVVGGMKDMNADIEFTLRARLFTQKYTEVLDHTDAIMLERWRPLVEALDISGAQKQALFDMWRVAKDNPEQLRSMMAQLIEGAGAGGRPAIHSIFTPENMDQLLKGLTPVERNNIIFAVHRHLDGLFRGGRTPTADEISNLFSSIVRSIDSELQDVASDSGRHTIRDIRQSLSNRPNLDAEMPDPEDVVSGAARNPRRVEQVRPVREATAGLTPDRLTPRPDAIDEFVQNFSDAARPFADFEVADDIDGLARTVFDGATGRPTIQISPELLNKSPDQIRQTLRQSIEDVFAVHDRTHIIEAFGDGAEYRAALRRFLSDPNELRSADPGAYRFIARQMGYFPSEARVLEAMAPEGVKYTELLPSGSLPFDESNPAARELMDLADEEMWGHHGVPSTPNPEFLRAGEAWKQALGKARALDRQLQAQAREASGTVLGELQERITIVQEFLSGMENMNRSIADWTRTVWPGPLRRDFGAGRADAWSKHYYLFTQRYRAGAGWAEDIITRIEADDLAALQEIRNISPAEMLIRSGFDISPDEARLTLRGAPFVGTSYTRHIHGLYDRLGITSWEDLWRPWSEIKAQEAGQFANWHAANSAVEIHQRIAQRLAQEVEEEAADLGEEAVQAALDIELDETVNQYTRAQVRKRFVESWGLPEEQVDAGMTLLDGMAGYYARITGRSTTDFYARHFGDIIMGGEPGSDALFQHIDNFWAEFQQQYGMHYESGRWVGGVRLEEGARVGREMPDEFSEMPESVRTKIASFLDPDQDEIGMWHVTTDRPGVLSGGLKSSSELGRQALGQATPSRYVSITYDAAHASRIEDRLRFMVRAANGETEPGDVLRAFEDWFGQDTRPIDVMRALRASAPADASYGLDLQIYLRGVADEIENAITRAGMDTGDPAAWRITEDIFERRVTDPEAMFEAARRMDLYIDKYASDPGLDLLLENQTVGVLASFNDIKKINPDNISTVQVGARKVLEYPSSRHFPGEFELQFKPEDLWVMEAPGAEIASPEAVERFFQNAARKGMSPAEVAANLDADMRLVIEGMAAWRDVDVEDMVEALMAGAAGPENLDDLFRSRMDALFQTDSGVRRASFELMEDGRAILRALDSPNVSSMMHEINHVFVSSLERLADEGFELAARDLKVMSDHLAEQGLEMAEGRWTEEMKEYIAGAFERYLRDGEAPTPELEGVFARFKGWLQDIYKKLTGTPLFRRKVQGTPLQDVFDRWVSGEVDDFIEPGELVLSGASLNEMPRAAAIAVKNQIDNMLRNFGEEGRRIWVRNDAGELIRIEGESSTYAEFYRKIYYGDEALEIAADKKANLAERVRESLERMANGEVPQNALDEKVRKVVWDELGADLEFPEAGEILPNIEWHVANREFDKADELAQSLGYENLRDYNLKVHDGQLDLAEAQIKPAVSEVLRDVSVTEMDDPNLAEVVKMEARLMMQDIMQGDDDWRLALGAGTREQVIADLERIIRGETPNNPDIRRLLADHLEGGVMFEQQVRRPTHPYVAKLLGRSEEQVDHLRSTYNSLVSMPEDITEYVAARATNPEFEENAAEMWRAFVVAHGLDNWGDEVVSSPERFRAMLIDRIAELEEQGFWETAPESMESLQLLIQKVDNYRSLRDSYGHLLGTEPMPRQPIAGLLPVPLPEWEMPFEFRQWLRHNLSEHAKVNRVRTALAEWEQYLLDGLENKSIFVQMSGIPKNQLDEIMDVIEQGARMKANAVDVAIHGDPDIIFPELARALPDARFGMEGIPGAIEEVNWSMLDYSNYNRLDNIMRNFIPFWMFPSRSLPYWVETLAMHPELVVAYERYKNFSQRLAYQHGATMSNGEPLPSFDGYIPIPGTKLWFNPTAPLSMRYVIEGVKALIGGQQQDYYIDEDNENEKPVMTQLAQVMFDYGRLFGITPGPWITVPMYWMDSAWNNGRLAQQYPPFSVVPQIELVPVWTQRAVLEPLRRIFGPGFPDSISVEVSWKDYLIERQLLANALQRIENASSMAEKEAIIQEVKAALGYRKIDDATHPTGFELDRREDNPLWIQARREVEESDLSRTWQGYFTGIYPKEFTDSQAMLLELRDEINLLRDSVNNQMQAEIFGFYEDPVKRYEYYTDRRYNTPEGWIRNLYGSIGWVRSPDGSEAAGLERRQLVAANIHENVVTSEYFAALTKFADERDREIQNIPIGDADARGRAWERYFKKVEQLENSPMYAEARRVWTVGYKPSEMIEEDFRNQFMYLLYTTRPRWDKGGGESYPEFQERVEQWEQEIPFIAQKLRSVFTNEEVLPRLLGEHTPRRQIAGEPDIKISDDRIVHISTLIDNILRDISFDDVRSWQKSRHTEIDALNEAWAALVWDPYWDIIGTEENKFRQEQKSQEFLDQYSQPTMDELIQWVMMEYPGRWTPEQIERAAKGGILDAQDRLAPETERATKEDEIWNVILMAGPNTSELRDKLDEVMQFGASKLQTWYDIHGHSEAFGNQDDFDRFHEAMLKAANELGYQEPTKEQLLEWAEVRDLDSHFDFSVSAVFGDSFIQDVMAPYWRLDAIFDREERKEYREAHPEVEQYQTYEKAYAIDNPLWAKYMKPWLYEDILSGDLSSEGLISGSSKSSGGSGVQTARSSSIRPSSGGGGSAARTTLQSSGGESFYLPMGYRGIDDPTQLMTRQLGRGGVAGKPYWPQGFPEIAGGIAAQQIVNLIEESIPLPELTQEYLKGVAERHPHFEVYVEKLLEVSAELVSGGEIDFDPLST